MALEASDISDSGILDNTKQYQNGNGQIQFKITLPSGREIESEWLNPEQKKKAMVAWLDVVKDQALQDSDTARQEARELAMKERSAALLAQRETQEQASTPSTEYPAETPLAGPVATVQAGMPSALGVRPRTSAINSPDDFVAVGLQAAEADYVHWNDVCMDAAQRMTQARLNIQKWSNIKKALAGNGANAQVSSGNSADSSGNVPVIQPVRKRRAKRTVATAKDWTAPGSPNEYDV